MTDPDRHPRITLHTSDPGSSAPVGELRGTTVTWPAPGPGQIVSVSRAWDAAQGGRTVCEAPDVIELGLGGVSVRLCGVCPSCLTRGAP